MRRNRAKRLLRELVRGAEKNGLLQQRQLVIVAREALLRKDFVKLQEEFAQCLSKCL